MRLTIAVASIALLSTQAGSSTGASREEAKPSPPVIRISTELVQLDAVVTDKKGHHVTDLQPGDFEVFQDGRPQQISRLSYVRTAAPAAATVRPAQASGIAPSAPTSVEARTEIAPRTIVFVVDDLGMNDLGSSPGSFMRTRRAVKHVVESLDPADRAEVVTTTHGFQQLQPTTDRKALLAAVEGLRRTAWTRDELRPLLFSQATFYQLFRYDGARFDDWNSRLALQSLAVVKQTVKELKPLPGRKALLLVSEGFLEGSSLATTQLHYVYWPLDALYGDAIDVIGTIRRLGDFAARSGVVIDVVDPRGLVTGGLNAEQSVPYATTPGVLGDVGLATRLGIQHSQAWLQYLADETGGLAMLNTNDISGAMSEVVSDLSGYYLIGYQPASGTFSGAGFHHVTVKVKQPGLKVRSRKGFFAVTDEQVAAAMK